MEKWEIRGDGIWVSGGGLLAESPSPLRLQQIVREHNAAAQMAEALRVVSAAYRDALEQLGKRNDGWIALENADAALRAYRGDS